MVGSRPGVDSDVQPVLRITSLTSFDYWFNSLIETALFFLILFIIQPINISCPHFTSCIYFSLSKLCCPLWLISCFPKTDSAASFPKGDSFRYDEMIQSDFAVVKTQTIFILSIKTQLLSFDTWWSVFLFSVIFGAVAELSSTSENKW